MKVICDRSALVETLNIAGGVVVSRTPKPVLTCIKLIAADDELCLEATDMEVSVRVRTPRVEVADAGEAVIPADKLVQIVKESSDTTLTLETEQESAFITGADSKFKVYGHRVNDFPKLPEMAGAISFEIHSRELSKIIHLTLYATARENSRYAINGVLLERDGNKLSVVATDGHRLALAKGDCVGQSEGPDSAIIPSKALNMLQKLLGGDERMVKVAITGNQIAFDLSEADAQGALLISNLVEGNFPPYKDVIPKDCDKRATLHTDLFMSGVRRAALLANEESKGIRLNFSPEGLKLSSRAPDMGEAEVNVPSADYTGDPVEIGFNPAYIQDALKVVDEDSVTIDLKASNKPGMIRCGSEFTYVVMPVNLN